MRVHELKTIQPFFDDVARGIKTFEIRLNDRGFQAGDILLLREWDEDADKFGQRIVVRTVAYVLQDERFLQPGYCCMGLYC